MPAKGGPATVAPPADESALAEPGRRDPARGGHAPGAAWSQGPCGPGVWGNGRPHAWEQQLPNAGLPSPLPQHRCEPAVPEERESRCLVPKGERLPCPKARQGLWWGGDIVNPTVAPPPKAGHPLALPACRTPQGSWASTSLCCSTPFLTLRPFRIVQGQCTHTDAVHGGELPAAGPLQPCHHCERHPERHRPLQGSTRAGGWGRQGGSLLHNPSVSPSLRTLARSLCLNLKMMESLGLVARSCRATRTTTMGTLQAGSGLALLSGRRR